MPRRTGDETRAELLDVAARHLSNHGYTGMNVGEVAAELGISRAAAMFHFESKAGLAAAVVLPYLERLDRILDHYPAQPRGLSTRLRKEFFSALLDLFTDMPDAMDAIARDRPLHKAMGVSARVLEVRVRITDLLLGNDQNADSREAALLLTAATLGLLTRPIGVMDPLRSQQHRNLILTAAERAITTPLTTSK